MSIEATRMKNRITVTLESGESYTINEGDLKRMAYKPETFRGNYPLSKIKLNDDGTKILLLTALNNEEYYYIDLIEAKIKVSINPDMDVPISWLQNVELYKPIMETCSDDFSKHFFEYLYNWYRFGDRSSKIAHILKDTDYLTFMVPRVTILLQAGIFSDDVDDIDMDMSKSKLYQKLGVPKALWSLYRSGFSSIGNLRSGYNYKHYNAPDDKELFVKILVEMSKYVEDVASRFGYDFPYAEINQLVVDHNYELPRLIEYLMVDVTRQGIPSLYSDDNFKKVGINDLVDYVKMSTDMGIKDFEKYPKYLKVAHDVVLMNYQLVIDEINEKKFQGRMKYFSGLVKSKKWDNASYTVVVPTETKELVKEGSELNHCVGSYVSRVINNEQIVMFIRKKSDKGKSLITFDINPKTGRLNNAEGYNRRKPYGNEKEFLAQVEQFFISNLSKQEGVA